MIRKQLFWDFPLIGKLLEEKYKTLKYIAFWIDEKNKLVEYYFFHTKESYKIYKTKIFFKDLDKFNTWSEKKSKII